MLTIEREIASQPEVWRRSAGLAEVAVALARGRDPNFPPAPDPFGGAQLTAPPTLDRARRTQ
jgi:hypothetical protein